MTLFSVRQHRGFTANATWWSSLNAERSNENRVTARTRTAGLARIDYRFPPHLQAQFEAHIRQVRLERAWA